MMRMILWPMRLPALRSLCWALRFLLLVTWGFWGPAQAVLLTPLSIESLSQEADWIIQGRVLSKTCQQDDSGRIYTRVELELVEVWKGKVPGTRVMVVHGGGILGERQSIVSGQVDYQIGEEVVAFLVLNRRGESVTLGLTQGKFHVWLEDGKKLARNPFHGGKTAVGSTKQQGGATDPDRLTLTRLREVVQKGTR